MGGRVARAPTSADRGAGRAAAELCERLSARKPEIEQAILTRVYALGDPSEVADPTYLQGLRTAVETAIEYGLEGIRSSERNPPPIPAALLVQARMAARNGVELDTVLRRYFAGYSLFGDFLVEEAAKSPQGALALKRLLRLQARLLDSVIAAISEEHRRDEQQQLQTGARRRLDLVQRLLDGEPLDGTELAYDLDATHLGLVAQGAGAQEAIVALARALDRRLLLVCPEEEVVWAWLGGKRILDLDEMRRASHGLPEGVLLATGEPGGGPAAWRLTHRQARAALPVALRGPEPFVRYAEVALLASMLQDELLVTSLREIYLVPLQRERAKVTWETLRAYLTCGRNITSAAAALGVNRNTVANRIRSVEETIGRPLDAWTADLEGVLRLEELER